VATPALIERIVRRFADDEPRAEIATTAMWFAQLLDTIDLRDRMLCGKDELQAVLTLGGMPETKADSLARNTSLLVRVPETLTLKRVAPVSAAATHSTAAN
jgi:hypothetical protein